jgi:hypothetical protein
MDCSRHLISPSRFHLWLILGLSPTCSLLSQLRRK